MLIKALCDYYDILADAGKVLPEGYSSVKIHYMVSLTEEGKIDGILNWKEEEKTKTGQGKEKTREIPRNVTMPQRTEKSGIEANIIEHRPLYLFGLNLTEQGLTPVDRTDKAKKSHEACVKENLAFLEGMDSPVVNAYRKFLENWEPEEEVRNPYLLGLGKDYEKTSYIFCLSGFPDVPLQDDPQIKEKWEQSFQNKAQDEEVCVAQCAVSGKKEPISRIHSKIKGVYGGLATGTVLIGFNNPSEVSYGKVQAYNSNISERAARKYSEVLNYLLSDTKHKFLLDDVTVVFWASDASGTYEDRILAMLCGQSEQMNAEQTERMLKALLEDGRKGRITKERLQSLDTMDPNVDFYMIGLKPNSSRLAIKFIYRKKYGEILWNIARFQGDLQVTEEIHSVSFSRIKAELLSPKAKTDYINPALISKVFEAALYGREYPVTLMETTVRRIKTDKSINWVRAGILKACLNRNYKKEEITVGLNQENRSQAYLCGRLFAVLEKLQQEAAGGALNRTIKDAYFASACAKPALVFPKLVMLAQNHLRKVKAPLVYQKRIEEIIDGLDGRFPDTLSLVEQGEFQIGYYQQNKKQWEKNERKKEREEE